MKQSFDVVITGASGFLGRALKNKLSERGIKVKGYSRRSIEGLVTVKSYADIPSSAESILVHLAQPRNAAEGAKGDEVQICRSLASGTWKHIVYASSAVVYGEMEVYPRKPDEYVSSIHDYANVKLECEAIVTAAGGTCIRLSNLYGPGMDENAVISDILKQIPGEDNLEVRDSSPVRDFLWINDAVNCLALAIIHRPGGILNCGSGHGISIGQLAKIVLELAREPERSVVSRAATPRETCLILNISKTQKVLGWVPETELRQGLSYLINMKTLQI